MMMKKMLISVFIISTVLFCSCGKDPAVAGDTLIKNARVDYRSLDSARVVMTNTETNEVEQTFEFKYDEKGFLTYSYEGVNGDEAYAQYNNGAESYTYENGKFEYLRKGDKNFAVYTRDITHPQADEGLIVFMPKAVADDGLLDITLIKPLHWWHIVFRLRRLFNGDIYSIGHVKHYRGRHIRIESTPDIMVEVDGELLGGTPLEFKIHPRCVRVIVNKEYFE
mgnify:CR=1 FL=1